jgi:hypothetical protein
MSVAEVYSTREYCIEEIMRIREMWSNIRTFTPEAIAAARVSLGFMMLYCPEEIQSTVEATLNELSQREVWYLLYGKQEERRANEKQLEKQAYAG